MDERRAEYPVSSRDSAGWLRQLYPATSSVNLEYSDRVIQTLSRKNIAAPPHVQVRGRHMDYRLLRKDFVSRSSMPAPRCSHSEIKPFGHGCANTLFVGRHRTIGVSQRQCPLRLGHSHSISEPNSKLTLSTNPIVKLHTEWRRSHILLRIDLKRSVDARRRSRGSNKMSDIIGNCDMVRRKRQTEFDGDSSVPQCKLGMSRLQSPKNDAKVRGGT